MRSRKDNTTVKPEGSVRDAITGYLVVVLSFVSFLLVLWIVIIVVRLLVG